jgi:hypothetical protein
LAHELLFSFSDVSDYIDTILLSYAAYRIDFKLIRRADFDFVCRRIQPEQVISLILSDDNDTPGQTELLFSRFRLEEFIYLRSRTLIKIEFESFETIFVNLNKLKQLKALSFNNDIFRSKYPLRFWDDSDACNQLNLLSHIISNQSVTFEYEYRFDKDNTFKSTSLETRTMFY